MRNINKYFPGVKALSNVNLYVKEREIHALVGENGAGKSTLMNILSGVYPSDAYEGEIYVEGKLCQFKNIKDSEKEGIAIIHQELALIPYMSAAENVFLGNEKGRGFVINWNQTYQSADQLLERVGYTRGSSQLVKNLSVGEQQLVEIAKALSKKVKLFILDEPTSALNEAEANSLLDLLLQLREEGVTSIIISHKLNEVKRIADRITILRDGAVVETLDNKDNEISEDRIIVGMVGREIPDIYPDRNHAVGEVMFEVKNWNVFKNDKSRQVLYDVNINVRKGEVVGIAGLMGAGRTEFALSVFGHSYGTGISGTVLKEGKPVSANTVSDAIKNGIAYTTEDRKAAGLILSEEIQDNIVLASLWNISRRGIRNKDLETRAAKKEITALSIKCTSEHQKTVNLSGGNQQKVVLAKWILSSPDVLILDEPTRGIDVGAKREVYCIMNDLAESGKSILFISSELPELLGMCDRIYVLNEGRIAGELRSDGEFSQAAVMACIMKSNRGKQ
jgi:putative multiple sugar transport system ATP-binding protein